MGQRGFILQPTYRIEAGRPVVHLFGRLESGAPFLVRDDRLRPHFYIRTQDAERAGALGAALKPSSRTTFEGDPVTCVEVAIPSDAPRLRNRLKGQGIACYEADVRFAMRYLIDRGIRGSFEIESPGQDTESIGRVFRNPRLRPCQWTPQLRLLSIDIETDPRASRLLSIALEGCGASEVLLLTPPGADVPQQAVPLASERALLEEFCKRVQQLDPDVLTGWNVVDFDFQVLSRLAAKQRVSLRLGRDSQALRLRDSRSPWSSREALVSGRLIIDGIELLRGAFVRMDSYALDSVAQEVLGEGKTITGPHRALEILEAFERRRARFVEYNLTDARLVVRIIDRLKLLDLAVERSLLTGLPIDRTAASVAAFDFLYLSRLHQRRIVAPSVGSLAPEDVAPAMGGTVLEPRSGLYDNVLTFDFKSLYPSLIRTFHIDPLGFRPRPKPDEEVLRTPNGAAFVRRPGILPAMLDELFPRREAAKASGDKVAAHAIKILMNSFYGVLGTPACRFYRPQLAEAITSMGREILLWTKKRLEDQGFEVLYGDTDSLFVLSGETEASAAHRRGLGLVDRLNGDLMKYVQAKWGVESRLELELERVYLKLHLPPMRSGRGGARKRYAGIVAVEGAEPRMIFTGMESVRRDWTALAKRVQRGLYQRLFDGVDMQDYLSRTVRDLRQGRFDESLIYRKALRKALDAYVRVTPPHVAAARKLSRPAGRVISYLMTVAGPEPVEEHDNPIDYEHYVQKQVRPVSEPILDLLDLNFDRVIGDDRQLSLF